MNNRPVTPPATAELAAFLDDVDWRPSTRRVAANTLNRFARFLEDRGTTLLEASRRDIEAFLGRPHNGRKLAPTTQESQLIHLRGFYGWATSEDVDLIDRNPARKVSIDTPGETRGEVISFERVTAMIDHTDKRTEFGRRDVAIMRVLLTTGMRRSEVASLNLEDYVTDPAPVLLVGDVHRPTKNRRNRIVPLDRDTVRALNLYLLKRGRDAGPLFRSLNSASGRLTPSGISQVIDRARLRIGLPEPIGVHSFRRAGAIECKRRGISDNTVKTLYGWTDDKMLALYTRAADTELAHQEWRAMMDQDSRESSRSRPRPRRKRPDAA